MSPLRGIKIEQSPDPLLRILSAIFHPDDLLLYYDDRDSTIPNVRWRRSEDGTIPTAPCILFITLNLPCLLILVTIAIFTQWLTSAALAWTDSHILIPVLTNRHAWPFIKALAVRSLGITARAAFCASIVFFILIATLVVVGIVGYAKRFRRYYKPRPYRRHRGAGNEDGDIVTRAQCLRYLNQGSLIIRLARYRNLFNLEPSWLCHALNTMYLGPQRLVRWFTISVFIPMLVQEGIIGYRSLVGETYAPLQSHEIFPMDDDGIAGGEDRYHVVRVPRSSDTASELRISSHYMTAIIW
ncbi:hypothetical protein F4678DRAFT_430032 [Xylaria arbuscula]|nr:hypothetical protein F4678DRAFT_430032 [Xylaria arbuscula]